VRCLRVRLEVLSTGLFAMSAMSLLTPAIAPLGRTGSNGYPQGTPREGDRCGVITPVSQIVAGADAGESDRCG
jgi:hypothetical protein